MEREIEKRTDYVFEKPNVIYFENRSEDRSEAPRRMTPDRQFWGYEDDQGRFVLHRPHEEGPALISRPRESWRRREKGYPQDERYIPDHLERFGDSGKWSKDSRRYSRTREMYYMKEGVPHRPAEEGPAYILEGDHLVLQSFYENGSKVTSHPATVKYWHAEDEVDFGWMLQEMEITGEQWEEWSRMDHQPGKQPGYTFVRKKTKWEHPGIDRGGHRHPEEGPALIRQIYRFPRLDELEEHGLKEAIKDNISSIYDRMEGMSFRDDFEGIIEVIRSFPHVVETSKTWKLFGHYIPRQADFRGEAPSRVSTTRIYDGDGACVHESQSSLKEVGKRTVSVDGDESCYCVEDEEFPETSEQAEDILNKLEREWRMGIVDRYEGEFDSLISSMRHRLLKKYLREVEIIPGDEADG